MTLKCPRKTVSEMKQTNFFHNLSVSNGNEQSVDSFS